MGSLSNTQAGQAQQQLQQSALGQQQAAQGVTLTTSTGSTTSYTTLPISGATAGSILTYPGTWSTTGVVTYSPPTIVLHEDSIIEVGGVQTNVKDLMSRLTELEEKFKNLKFTVELLRP